MKILVIGPQFQGSLPSSYARAFEAAGHKVVCFDAYKAYENLGSYPKNRVIRRLVRPRLWNALNVEIVRAVRSAQADLVLVFKAPFLHPKTVLQLRQEAGVPVVNYYPDNPYGGVSLIPNRSTAQRRDILSCLKSYSQVFIWSRHLVQRLGQDGVNVAYLPFGVDHFIFNQDSTGVQERFKAYHEAVFVGECNPKRDKHFSAVREHRLTLWGPFWEKASRAVQQRHEIRKDRASGRACASVYRHADVAMNVVHDFNMPGHNMRTFEIPACGGVMIATFTQEQNDFFPEGKAAFYYRDPSEIDGIISRLKADRQERRRVGELAMTIAKDHTYIKRAVKLITLLNPNGGP